MGRSVKIDIGVNGAFSSRRWEEPDSWIHLTRDAGYPYHEFCADLLDPFFCGNRRYQTHAAREVRRAAESMKLAARAEENLSSCAYSCAPCEEISVAIG